MSDLIKPPILDDTGQTIKTKLTAILQSLQNIAIDLSLYMKKGVDYVTAGKASGTTVGTGSTVEGTNNTVTGQYSTVEGHDNTVSASYSHCGGYQNTVAGANAFAHGVGLITHGGEAVFGKYNAEDALGNYHFIIGNGSSNNRKNAFMIDNDNGNGWFGNDIYAGRSNGINVSTAQGQKKIPTSQDVVSYLNSNLGKKLTLYDADLSVYQTPKTVATKDFNVTTNSNGDANIAIAPYSILSCISITGGVNGIIRTSGDGSQTVVHCTDNSNANVTNTSVTVKMIYLTS